MQVSPIMRRGRAQYFHWCPACEEHHPLPDSWTFNGDVVKPTFSPSFKQTFTHWTGGIDEKTGLGRGERQERVCHYIITAGVIQFCADSWHVRSDIVAMPNLPDPADTLLANDKPEACGFAPRGETQD